MNSSLDKRDCAGKELKISQFLPNKNPELVSLATPQINITKTIKNQGQISQISVSNTKLPSSDTKLV